MIDNLANVQKNTFLGMSKMSSKILPCLLNINCIKIIILYFHTNLYIHHIIQKGDIWRGMDLLLPMEKLRDFLCTSVPGNTYR